MNTHENETGPESRGVESYRCRAAHGRLRVLHSTEPAKQCSGKIIEADLIGKHIVAVNERDGD